jgi:dTDP-4-dehydrorhamnose reductase
MKILLLGARGQLGTDFQKVLAADEVAGVDLEEIDVRIPEQVSELVQSQKPALVINCTAYNRVDEAEDHPEAAFAVNTHAVRHIAVACRAVDAPLVHFSSDYVFDGPVRRPLTEQDLPCPRSVYGISKLAGEHMLASLWPKHYIIRTCGLYGYTGSREKGTNFVESILRAAKGGKLLRVIDDQCCTPTSTMDLAGAVDRLVRSGSYGLYHLTSVGACTWYEFAAAALEIAGLGARLEPVTSSAFAAKAKRPDYSVLDNAAFRQLGFDDLRPWREALADYIGHRPAPAEPTGN